MGIEIAMEWVNRQLLVIETFFACCLVSLFWHFSGKLGETTIEPTWQTLEKILYTDTSIRACAIIQSHLTSPHKHSGQIRGMS